MQKLIFQLFQDEAGFVVSSELILISTIAVLGLVVGLSSVAAGVNNELDDVANAFGSMNQNSRYSGMDSNRGGSDITSVSGRGER